MYVAPRKTSGALAGCRGKENGPDVVDPSLAITCQTTKDASKCARETACNTVGCSKVFALLWPCCQGVISYLAIHIRLLH